MSAPVFSQSDFASAMQYLMPRGRAWPRDPASLQSALILGLAATYARLQNRDNDLISEALPSSTNQLLPEWESSLGLPDPCSGGGATTAARRAQVVARFADGGGQSTAFFIAYAATLGYAITITYGALAYRFGARFGGHFASDLSAYTWTVNTPGPGPIKVLECEFARLKPAHTTVVFNYT